ncbi:MAG: AAA family ATPase [Clostridia bacterium]|nr:AAA family ATPase [Clostridia bacterium]
MANVKSNNVPTMDVDGLIENLCLAYSKIINGNLPIKAFPSVMLWGAPGVGKSQAIRQMAKEIELQTGKKTVVTDVRLLLFNPIDLRGIPTANVDKTLSIWLKPQIFQMDDSEDVVNILFLDEISAAPQSVQAAAYQITLDRVVGEHKLPDNCIVIAAGNRITDKSVAYKMPKALANRLLHVNVESSFFSWKRWAIANGINKKVLGFLSFQKNYLMGFDTSNDDLAFATPRSWEMVSNILNNVSDDVNKVYGSIAGLVGEDMAIEFRAWDRLYSDLPKIEDIFEGKDCKIPTNLDAVYALTSSMVSYAREHKKQMDKIANSIRYAQKLPPDFSVMLLKDYMAIEKGYKEKLLSLPEFSRWLSTKGRLLNDFRR